MGHQHADGSAPGLEPLDESYWAALAEDESHEIPRIADATPESVTPPPGVGSGLESLSKAEVARLFETEEGAADEDYVEVWEL